MAKEVDTRQGSGAKVQLAVRNNNPGNIRVVGSDTEFQKFETMQDGFNALLRQIQMYQDGSSDNTTGEETLAELMAIYAPKKDNNDPVKYTNTLADRLGITADTLIKDINTNKLALAISEVESPQAYKAIISDENVDTGVPMSEDREPYFKGTGSLQIISSEKTEDGKYKTTFMNPEGKEDVITTKNPLKAKKVFGDEYLSEEGTDTSYEIITTPSGTIYPKKVADSRLAVNKIKDLSAKSKSGKPLTSLELNQLNSAWSIVDMDMKDEEEAARKGEGVFEDRLKKDYKGALERNAVGIRKRRNAWANDVLDIKAKEAKRRLDEDKRLHDEELKSAKEAATTGDISVDDLKRIKSDYDSWKKDWSKDDKKISTLIENREKGVYISPVGAPVYALPTGATVKATPSIDPRTGQKSTKSYLHVDPTNILKDIDSIGEKYKPVLTEEEKQVSEKTRIEGRTRRDGAAGTVKTDVTVKQPVLDVVDPNDVARKAITEEASKNEDFAKTLDKDYWQKQKQLNLETIKKLEAGSQMPDFTVKDDGQPNYQYIFGQAGDIARGLIGMAGATTDVPEREMSAMMRESLDDARIQKDMGLSAAERDFMKQNAERAFGFAQQASKVGGAAAYLGAGGRNAAMLQDQYARMGVTDAQLRRQSQARFDAAARDEQAFEERAFQDRYTQAMMAKEQGAALARDAYTNASERAQFESQYGKGSQYQQLMNEVIASKKQDIYLKQKGEEERINRAVEDRKKRNIEIDKNYLS